jgi:hypothetical protein
VSTFTRDRSKTILMIRWPRGKVAVGLFRWGRKTRGVEHTRGWTLRLFRFGHLNLSVHNNRQTGPLSEGRRRNHGIMLSWWGLSGRRRKRAIEIRVHL